MPGPLALLTVLVFALAGVAAVRAGWPLRTQARRLWLGLALGCGWLAVNKLFEVQERVHVAIHRLGFGDPPGLAGIDDLVLLGYGLAGVALLARYRAPLFAHRRSAAWIGLAGMLFAAAFLVDSFGPNHGALAEGEQWVELAGAVALTCAGLARAVPHPATRKRTAQAGTSASSSWTSSR